MFFNWTKLVVVFGRVNFFLNFSSLSDCLFSSYYSFVAFLFQSFRFNAWLFFNQDSIYINFLPWLTLIAWSPMVSYWRIWFRVQQLSHQYLHVLCWLRIRSNFLSTKVNRRLLYPWWISISFYGIFVGIIIIIIVINYCYSKFWTCIWLHLQMKCDIVLIML